MKTLFFQESFPMFLAIVFITTCFYIRTPHIGIICASVIILSALLFFYRVPDRDLVDPSLDILAASDGTVRQIDYDPASKTFTIIVFLNIFDQHLQCYPVSGTVVSTRHKNGTFHPAYMLTKSKFNERHKTDILTNHQGVVSITQIAGQVARRIVNYSKENNSVRQGEWMGMIKLSSRVDVSFSSEYFTPNVCVGEKIYARKTIIAIYNKS